MPIVLRVGSYTFGFYASDRDEPPHIHVRSQSKRAKFWLDPMALESAGRFRQHEVNEITRIIREHRTQLLESWHEFFRR
jgi:hypothetical protein